MDIKAKLVNAYSFELSKLSKAQLDYRWACREKGCPALEIEFIGTAVLAHLDGVSVELKEPGIETTLITIKSHLDGCGITYMESGIVYNLNSTACSIFADYMETVEWAPAFGEKLLELVSSTALTKMIITLGGEW